MTRAKGRASRRTQACDEQPAPRLESVPLARLGSGVLLAVVTQELRSRARRSSRVLPEYSNHLRVFLRIPAGLSVRRASVKFALPHTNDPAAPSAGPANSQSTATVDDSARRATLA